MQATKEGGGLGMLIVARPGRWRDALQAVVRAMPRIERVDLAGDGRSALGMIAAHPPALILLDANLADEDALILLGWIKARWPEIRYLLLINADRKLQAADAGGADVVLRKGFRAGTLIEAIDRLLPPIG